MARRRSLVALLTLLTAVLVTACEQEGRPSPEPAAAAKPVAVNVARPGSAAAPTPEGVCGAEDEQKGPSAACGSGCGCNGATCADPTAKVEGCGCGMHDQGKADAPLVPITEAKVGDRTRCPVTNQVFVVAADSPKTDFAGKTYYFCCEGCVNKFKQHPEQFTNS